MRKRSANVASATGFICAKAKRQRQMFFVRKRSANVASATGFYLRESEAAAADVFCAKAQCQRSVSNRVLS
ncbi:hypothetical protein ACPCXF_17575, partial [Lysinibacillus agricola]